MAVVNLRATARRGISLAANNDRVAFSKPGKNTIVSTVELPAAVSATSTAVMAVLPSNARLLPSSTIYWDDLASVGAPTMDVGLYGSQITDDADALSANHGVATAAGSARMHTAIENFGKMLWELAGETEDPGGVIEIRIAILDADANTGGTVSALVDYSID